jgi:hypothetical protein
MEPSPICKTMAAFHTHESPAVDVRQQVAPEQRRLLIFDQVRRKTCGTAVVP